METGALIVFLVCTGAFCALTAAFTVAFRASSEEAAARRRLRRFPAVRLSDARPGKARVTGRVITVGDPLHAPLSGRPCAYHEVALRIVYQWAYGRKSEGVGPLQNIAATTVKVRAGKTFEIDDGSGRALVNLAATQIYSSIPASHQMTGAGGTIPHELIVLAGRTGVLLDVAQAIEGDEAIIAEGDVVTVAGRLDHEIRADGDAESYRSPRLRSTLNGEPLILVKEEKPTG